MEEAVKRLLFALAVPLLVMSAAPAAAQITTAVTPPRPERPAEDPVEVRVRRTERLEGRVTEMRAWVDSVAIETDAAPSVPDTAVVSPPRPVRDQQVPPAQAERPPLPAPRQPPPPTREFREGAPAPATATPLPLLTLLGAAAVAAGALLRGTRRP